MIGTRFVAFKWLNACKINCWFMLSTFQQIFYKSISSAYYFFCVVVLCVWFFFFFYSEFTQHRPTTEVCTVLIFWEHVSWGPHNAATVLLVYWLARHFKHSLISLKSSRLQPLWICSSITTPPFSPHLFPPSVRGAVDYPWVSNAL